LFTGDHILIARNTALQLDMGDKIFTAERLPLLDPETHAKPANLSQDYGDLCLIADGFAQVYPEHKYLIVECLRELGYVRTFKFLSVISKAILHFQLVFV
jgi:H+-transporting ATPase